jgi:hypothetical protein
MLFSMLGPSITCVLFTVGPNVNNIKKEKELTIKPIFFIFGQHMLGLDRFLLVVFIFYNYQPKEVKSLL